MSHFFNSHKNSVWQACHTGLACLNIQKVQKGQGAFHLFALFSFQEAKKLWKVPKGQQRFVSFLMELLQPHQLMDKYCEHAPFTWKLLHTFAAMPNKFQKQRENKRLANSSEGEDSDDDWEDDPKLADDEPMKILIRGACVKVCRTLLQGCVRLRQDSRELESEVSN